MRAIFGTSTAATVVVPFSPRFRFLVLLVRMCWLNALPRRNLPFLVRLKRLAAPRWVFSLIFFTFDIVDPVVLPPSSLSSQNKHFLCVLLCGLCDLRGFFFVRLL